MIRITIDDLLPVKCSVKRCTRQMHSVEESAGWVAILPQCLFFCPDHAPEGMQKPEINGLWCGPKPEVPIRV